MKNKVYVLNLRGEKEPFSFSKVLKSAKNAGASKELAFQIAKQIEKEVFEGMKTSEIFERIYQLLSEKSFSSAIRLNLKKAIERLGPTGFPFEKFVGKILEKEGFQIKLNQEIPGFCTNYEIDFLAQKDNFLYIGECKFHHLPGGRIDLQVALANYARFLDIEKGRFLNSGIKYKSLLVTNTKFTSKAIQYSRCVGVELLGWKYPAKGGLESLIEKNELYPITILPSVSQNLAKFLIEQKIILAKDVLSKNFEKLNIAKKGVIFKEVRDLFNK